MTISVAIVEDNHKLRHQLARFLDESPGFRCSSASGSAEEALRVIPASPPDVVLMDVQLPGKDGIACTAALKSRMPVLRVMMLTAYEDNEVIFRALQAGASGYLLKRSAPTQLLSAIAELHRGGAPMTSEVARKVIDSFHRLPTAIHPDDQLTPKEEEVLKLLAKGYSPKDIAEKLDVTYDTIRYHLKHIYDKLHVHSRTEAVLKYLG